MDTLVLTAPDPMHADSYRAYVAALAAAGEQANYARALRDTEDDFEGFIQWLAGLRMGLALPDGCLAQHVFWLLYEGQVVGESQVTQWRDRGFSIGYTIHPSERRKGYGTRLLALTLLRAQVLGAVLVNLTCRTGNTASARIIVRNGGVLVSEEASPKGGGDVRLRYRITL